MDALRKSSTRGVFSVAPAANEELRKCILLTKVSIYKKNSHISRKVFFFDVISLFLAHRHVL